ncbi:MAG: LytR/AlgR family response regulator transcription factor, partial [Bacteroidia bacterium]
IEKVNALRKSLLKHSYPVQSETISPKTYQTSFIVRFREKMIPIEVAEIAMFYLENEIQHVLKLNGETSAIFKTLDEIEQALNPAQFFRINRQMIVNRKAIQDIEPYFNRKVIVNLQVKTQEKLVVSRLKVSAFKQWLEL